MFRLKGANGQLHPAVGDPLDIAAQRAVEIMGGGPTAIAIELLEGVAPTALVPTVCISGVAGNRQPFDESARRSSGEK